MERHPSAMNSALNVVGKNIFVKILALLLVISSLAQPAYAGVEDEPEAAEMVADLAIARPLGLAATVLGSVAFVVSLPFSAAGGNVSEAADTLVMKPVRETFVRCLGCKTSGRYQNSN